MSRSWQIQEAKNKLSEVIDEALENGPQILTRRGETDSVMDMTARGFSLPGGRENRSQPPARTAGLLANALVRDFHLGRNVSARIVGRPGALEGAAHVEVCADHAFAAVGRC